MARITKGKTKLCRRERYDLFPRIGDKSPTNKRLAKRTPPGEHFMFSRQSLYAVQLREKQKVKRMYGLLERQFRRFYSIASKSDGQTGLTLLQLLECRLDNVVYRSGMALTRDQARQMVNHGHVLVNGKKNNIPSHILKTGDVISLKDKISNQEWYKAFKKEIESYPLPNWIQFKKENSTEISQLPSREDIDLGIKEQLIVEFYSK